MHREVASSRRLLVLLECTRRLRRTTRFIAAAFARHPLLDVLICPWYRLDPDTARVSGRMWRVVDGVVEDVLLRDPRHPDVVFYQGTPGTGRPRTREELALLRRLGANRIAP